jgi:ribA/ribD-fused uncharacterized protein
MTNNEDFKKVLEQKTPKEAKIVAHSLPLVSNWEEIKFSVMKDVLTLKEFQNSIVRETLLKTGNRVIQEASPYDYIWGIGKDGSGQNLLGKAWMEVREEVRKMLNG